MPMALSNQFLTIFTLSTTYKSFSRVPELYACIFSLQTNVLRMLIRVRVSNGTRVGQPCVEVARRQEQQQQQHTTPQKGCKRNA